MRPGFRAALAAVVVLTSACEKHEFEPPDREGRVASADSLYSAVLFDTVQWESAEVRRRQGNAVYAGDCRRCHGTLGRGDTDYAREQGLDVPSLVGEDFAYETVDEVRRRIFVGHAEGMPNFGVGGLTPREIDAVATYVLQVLRPEAAAGPKGAGTPEG